MKQKSVLFSVVVFLFILFSFIIMLHSVSAGTCLVPGYGCVQSDASGCSASVGTYLGNGDFSSYPNCTLGCCEVNDSSGTNLYSKVYNGNPISQYVCKNIYSISKGIYNFTQFYSSGTPSPCDTCAGTDAGFSTCKACSLNVFFKFSDPHARPLDPTKTAYSFKLFYHGLQVYSTSGNGYSFSKSGIPIVSLSDCSKLKKYTYSLDVSSPGYISHKEQTVMAYNVSDPNLKREIVLYKPTNYWNFTFKSNIQSFGLTMYFYNESRDVVKEISSYANTNLPLSIPVNDSIIKIGFVGSFFGYKDASSTVSINPQTNQYDVTLYFSSKPVLKTVKVCSNEPSSFIYAYSAQNSEVFSHMTSSGNCADINLTDYGKYVFSAYKKGYISNSSVYDIESSTPNHYRINLTLTRGSSQALCLLHNSNNLAMTPSSPCLVPCRKFYNYSCSDETCSVSNKQSNWIVNQQQPGICDGNNYCNYEGNCVPMQNTCVHQGNSKDCLNENVLNGFLYCNQSNEIQFVNLTQMIDNGDYPGYSKACSVCSADPECHLCENPNPALNIFSKFSTCNISSHSVCNDRLLSPTDIARISQNQDQFVSNVWTKYNLSNSTQYFDYCFDNSCGYLDSKCIVPCKNLSKILQENGQQAVSCGESSDMASVFSFGTCPSGSNEVCGIPKAQMCYGNFLLGVPQLNHMARYLCLAQGGKLRNDNTCCDKPMPVNIPNCPTGVKLSLSSPNSEINSYFTSSSYSFNQHRSDTFCKCNFQYLNFSSDEYCCAYGASSTPCMSTFKLSLNVNHCFPDMSCKPASEFNFEINNSQGYDVFVSTDGAGKVTNLILPQGKYSIRLIHGFLSYNSSFDLDSNLNKTINISDDGSHVLMHGRVFGNETPLINLSNIDLYLPQLSLTYFTDSSGKFDFGYFDKDYFEILNMTVNTQNEFFEEKKLKVNLSDLTLSGYDVYLNSLGNASLTVHVHDILGNPINDSNVVFPNLYDINDSDRPVSFRGISYNNYTDVNGNISFAFIPCGKHDIKVTHLGYIDYNGVVNLRCGVNNTVNITLNSIDCIREQAKPVNVSAIIDSNGNVNVTWRFACPGSALGFYVFMKEDGMTTNNFGNPDGNLVSPLIRANNSFDYKYNFSLKELSYDLNSMRHPNQTTLSRTFVIKALWQKPYVKYTSSDDTEALKFNYNCINNAWYPSFCAVKFDSFFIDYSPVCNPPSASDYIYHCNSSYISARREDAQNCLTNKGNPIIFNVTSDSLNGKKWYLDQRILYDSYTGTASLFCNGPFNAFGRYYQANYRNNCSLLPFDKGLGAEDYYKSCSEVTSCYDYRTENACEQNTCLPTACKWNKLSSLNSSMNVSYNVGVCVPKDPNLINCSEYINYLNNSSNILFSSRPDIMCPLFGTLNDSMFYGGMRCKFQGGTGSSIMCVPETNPLFYDCTLNRNISNPYSHNYLDFSFCDGNDRLNYHLDSVSKINSMYLYNTYNGLEYNDIIPPKFFFENDYVYNSTESMISKVKNVSSYGIFDYDVDNVKHFDVDYKDQNNGFRNSKVSLPKLFNASSFRANSGISQGITLLETVNDIANNSYNYKSSIVEVDSAKPDVTLNYKIIQKIPVKQLNTTFYALDLKLNVSNEDWVVVNGNLTSRYIYFDGNHTASIEVKNFSVLDGLNDNRDYKLDSANYSGVISDSDLQQAKMYAISNNPSESNYINSFKGSMFLIPAGEYTLNLAVSDKIHNTWNKTMTFVLPKSSINSVEGYLKTYNSLPVKIFVYPNVSDVVSCKLSSSDIIFQTMTHSYSNAGNGNFTFEISKDNFASIFGTPFSSYNNSKLTIYSACNDSYGNIYQMIPIYFTIDKTAPQIMASATKISYSQISDKFENYGFYAGQKELLLNNVDPSKPYYLLCNDPSVSNTDMYYNESGNNTIKPIVPFEIPGEFGCGKVNVTNITAKVDVKNTTYYPRTTSLGKSVAETEIKFEKAGSFNVKWCDLGGNCKTQIFNVTLDHGTPAISHFKFNDALCSDGSSSYLLKSMSSDTNTLRKYNVSYDLLNVYKKSGDSVNVSELNSGKAIIVLSEGSSLDLAMKYSNSPISMNLSLNSNNLSINVMGGTNNISNVSSVMLYFDNGNLVFNYSHNNKQNTFDSYPYDKITGVSLSGAWKMMREGYESPVSSYVVLDNGFRTETHQTKDMIGHIMQTLLFSGTLSSGSHSLKIHASDGADHVADQTHAFNFYMLPKLKDFQFTYDKKSQTYGADANDFACLPDDYNMTIIPSMDWNNWDSKFWNLSLVVYQNGAELYSIPLTDNRFDISSLSNPGKYSFAINLSSNTQFCKPFSFMLPRFTLTLRTCIFPDLDNVVLGTNLINFSEPLTYNGDSWNFKTSYASGLYCNYVPSRAYFGFNKNVTRLFKGTTVVCKKSSGYSEDVPVTNKTDNDGNTIYLSFDKPLGDFESCNITFHFENSVLETHDVSKIFTVSCNSPGAPLIFTQSSPAIIPFTAKKYSSLSCSNASCQNRTLALELTNMASGGIISYNLSKIN